MPIRVACICPTADRSCFLERAVKCFQAQTYPHKKLVIIDSGSLPIEDPASAEIIYARTDSRSHSLTLGELRNLAIGFADDADLIAHFDDDDFSHANRLAEQVALIESTGADIVGYRDMLFYDSSVRKTLEAFGMKSVLNGELWLYSSGRTNAHMGCGTSYMYRRSVWEKRPFPAVTVREDETFLYRIPVEKRAFVSSLEGPQGQYDEPRMIAEIHGSNTMRNRDMSSHNWVKIVDEPMIAMIRKTLGYA